MANILVTGGTGLIGSHVIPLLIELGHYVTVVRRDMPLKHGNLWRNHVVELQSQYCNLSVIESDLADPNALIYQANPNVWDCVLHLAASAGVRTSSSKELMTNNVNVTTYLLDWLANSACKLIFTSSSSVYSPEGVVSPVSLYGLTKHIGEQLVTHHHRNKRVFSTIIRPFTVYQTPLTDSRKTHIRESCVSHFGGSAHTAVDQCLGRLCQRPSLFARPEMLISRLFMMQREHSFNKTPLQLFQPLETMRYYTHVDDVCDVIVNVIKYTLNAPASTTGTPDVFDVGNSYARTIRDVLNEFERKLNYRPQISYQLGKYNELDCQPIPKQYPNLLNIEIARSELI